MNKEGDTCFGQSPIAGKQAVFETALSRFVLPLPVMFFPTVLNAIMVKLRLLPKNQVLRNCFELSFVTFGLLVGLPMSLALYKQ
jgi:hypothetical protein